MHLAGVRVPGVPPGRDQVMGVVAVITIPAVCSAVAALRLRMLRFERAHTGRHRR